MPETIAASSPADPFNGESPTLAEFQQYRQTGEVPARFKPAENADAAPADQPEQTAAEGEQPESAPESATDDNQELPPEKRRGKTAEERKAQLRATIERLWEEEEPDTVKIAQLEATIDKIDARPRRKTATAPVTEQPQAQPQQPQYTRPKPAVDGNGPDGKPYATYEAYVEDLSRWNGEQLLAQYQQQEQQRQYQMEAQRRMDDARARYENADEVIFPTAKAILEAQIPNEVKAELERSELAADLCYVIGEDADELENFLTLAQRNPRAARAKIFHYEQAIREELANPGGSAPEVKRTQAPKPPEPVRGGSSRAFDVNDASLSSEEWARKRNKQLGIG